MYSILCSNLNEVTVDYSSKPIRAWKNNYNSDGYRFLWEPLVSTTLVGQVLRIGYTANRNSGTTKTSSTSMLAEHNSNIDGYRFLG